MFGIDDALMVAGGIGSLFGGDEQETEVSPEDDWLFGRRKRLYQQLQQHRRNFIPGRGRQAGLMLAEGNAALGNQFNQQQRQMQALTGPQDAGNMPDMLANQQANLTGNRMLLQQQFMQQQLARKGQMRDEASSLLMGMQAPQRRPVNYGGGIGGGLASLAQQVAYKNALGRGSGGATPPPAAGPGSSTYIQQRQAGNPYGAGGGMPHQPGTGGAPWSGGGVPPEPPYGTPEWYVWNARYGRLAG